MRRTHKKAVKHIKDGKHKDRVADLPRQLRACDRSCGKADPVRQLAAKISRAHADKRRAEGLFQRKDQDKHQRQVHDQRIDLPREALTPKQPEWQLDKQKQRAEGKNKPLFPLVLPAAGNERAEKQSVDQHKAIIDDAQQFKGRHRLTPPSL